MYILGRPISVDWAVAKDKYMQYIVNQQLEIQEDVKKEDSDSDDDVPNTKSEALKDEIKSKYFIFTLVAVLFVWYTDKK